MVGNLSLRLCEPPAGCINLTTAHMGTLDIRPAGDGPVWWPRCHLTDFSYGTLIATEGRRERLRWLANDPDGFSPTV